MKYIVTIIVTFFLAFSTTLLLDIPEFSQNAVRYILVVLLVLIELVLGFFYLKSQFKK